MVVAGVIDQCHGRGVGEHVGGDEVLATHFERIKTQFPAHLVDHTLKRIGRLGPPCPTIGIDRGGVGEHGFHVHIDMRHLIGASHQRAVQEGRRHGGEVRQIRPNVRHGLSADGEEIAFLVAGQFDLCHMVATMSVRQEAFRAFRRPAHRTTEPLGRGQHQGFFAVVIDFRAKAAAHIRRDHGQLVFRNPQNKGRHQKPRQVRVLAGRRQLVIPGAGEILTNRGARLHRVRHQTVVHQFQRGDMRRGFEGGVHGGAVVFDPAPVIALVVRDLVMHAVRRIRQSLGHVDDRGQFFDIGIIGQLLGRVFRLLIGLGDHSGIGIAHMAHFAMGQHRALRLAHRFAIARLDEPTRRVAAHVLEILASKDGQNARHRLGRLGVDRLDPAMRHGRADKDRIGLAVQRHVVGVNPATGQKADILAAL